MNAPWSFPWSYAPRALLAALAALVSQAACGGTPDPAPPAGGGLLSDQVYGTWTCETPGMPTFKFDVVRISQNGTLQQWHDLSAGGGAQDAYVHLDLLYLSDVAKEPFRNFSYTATKDAPDVLVALDQFDTSGVKYHCTKG